MNVQTAVLGTAVATQIATSQAGLLALDEVNRANILSALKVMTMQQSVSGDAALTTEKQAGEAAAAAIVSARQAQEVVDAKTRYEATGYRACGNVSKAAGFFGAVENKADTRRTILGDAVWKPGGYGDPADWISLSQSGPFDASTLFGGDAAKAAKYISFVMGPPDPAAMTAGNGIAAQHAKLRKAQMDSTKSMSAFVMADVASDFRTGGVVEKMRALDAHWVGEDGGETWAASIAGQSERGVLQDAVRMEAANIATLALQIKTSTREEAVTAALLLARVNRALEREGQASEPPAVGRGR
ncbi:MULTISPECIES: hypothetical protein [unclassified Xanthobacter]|uniref:hypothetical protein n=1 Tax=unclassified Xanthobacter TaxID=2623496 RepID=UPI001F3D6AC0|nr:MULTISPECIES: hypothetical protein [unclassified Xanthobacter]